MTTMQNWTKVHIKPPHEQEENIYGEASASPSSSSDQAEIFVGDSLSFVVKATVNIHKIEELVRSGCTDHLINTLPREFWAWLRDYTKDFAVKEFCCRFLNDGDCWVWK